MGIGRDRNKNLKMKSHDMGQRNIKKKKKPIYVATNLVCRDIKRVLCQLLTLLNAIKLMFLNKSEAKLMSRQANLMK